jgi:hypothetical protein
VPRQLTVKGHSRHADHGLGVPDEAARHYDEQQLAAPTLSIGTVTANARADRAARQAHSH